VPGGDFVPLKIFLGPNTKDPAALRDVYNKAVQEAEELYIATAYLMDWSGVQQVNPSCKRLVFLVGRDFGLTRKTAMLRVLNWMPSGAAYFYGAVLIGGFHPKFIAWKTHSGEHYCLIGSSNLSKAAFSDNHEANVLAKVSADEFRELCDWIDSIVENHAVPASKDYIENHYIETKLAGGKAKRKQAFQLKLQLPRGAACRKEVQGRRRQQARFNKIANKLRAEAARCSNGEITNGQFWERFWTLWTDSGSRFQGSGLQFTGKSANWRQACSALIKILEAGKTLSEAQLDQVVAGEIDALKKSGNPTRGAWLSEMLCHYFPELYPIKNAPVRKWLSQNKWRSDRRGATEGQKYTDLAKQLRRAVRDHRPAGARNLAELDAAIWRWVHDEQHK